MNRRLFLAFLSTIFLSNISSARTNFLSIHVPTNETVVRGGEKPSRPIQDKKKESFKDFLQFNKPAQRRFAKMRVLGEEIDKAEKEAKKQGKKLLETKDGKKLEQLAKDLIGDEDRFLKFGLGKFLHERNRIDSKNYTDKLRSLNELYIHEWWDGSEETVPSAKEIAAATKKIEDLIKKRASKKEVLSEIEKFENRLIGERPSRKLWYRYAKLHLNIGKEEDLKRLKKISPTHAKRLEGAHEARGWELVIAVLKVSARKLK